MNFNESFASMQSISDYQRYDKTKVCPINLDKIQDLDQNTPVLYLN